MFTQVIAKTRKCDGWTDRQTDRQTDGWMLLLYPSPLSRGDKKLLGLVKVF